MQKGLQVREYRYDVHRRVFQENRCYLCDYGQITEPASQVRAYFSDLADWNLRRFLAEYVGERLVNELCAEECGRVVILEIRVLDQIHSDYAFPFGQLSDER